MILLWSSKALDTYYIRKHWTFGIYFFMTVNLFKRPFYASVKSMSSQNKIWTLSWNTHSYDRNTFNTIYNASIKRIKDDMLDTLLICQWYMTRVMTCYWPQFMA